MKKKKQQQQQQTTTRRRIETHKTKLVRVTRLLHSLESEPPFAAIRRHSPPPKGALNAPNSPYRLLLVRSDNSRNVSQLYRAASKRANQLDATLDGRHNEAESANDPIANWPPSREHPLSLSINTTDKLNLRLATTPAELPIA